MKVPSGDTSVATMLLGSLLNCLAVKLNRQAIYVVRALFHCVSGKIGMDRVPSILVLEQISECAKISSEILLVWRLAACWCRQAIGTTGRITASHGAWRRGNAPLGGVGKTVALEERWCLAAGRYRQAV
ncbi:hypothetical protein DEO72_LG3g2386 [Vigna unguiculata]|uniref:Uncharacterized protein n=1 Tax=Vigna unguiculata TaxID=3917 RepID=A0A4D6LHM0_VIGUN|nr:hypothetical protein DEO72_LG3g2386 [Vigna unguiculata]